MNNFFTQLKQKALATKLSQNEKQVMRVQLYNYLEQNPAGTFDAPSKIYKATPSPLFFFSPRYLVPIALLLVVGLGSGTAFAAQGSLPGNPLYAIKINVNERLQTALATTPEAKASVHAELATTRLEEAETLAVNGQLDANTAANLTSNFTAHVAEAKANTDDLESKDPGTAAQLGAEFNGSLAAHSAILAQIGQDSKSDETMQNSNMLAMEVERDSGQGEGEGRGRGGDSATVTTLSVSAVSESAPVVATAAQTASDTSRVRTFAAAMPRATLATGSASTSKKAATTTPAAIPMAKHKDANFQPQVVASLSAQASTSLAAATADFNSFKGALDAATAGQISAQLSNIQSMYASANAEAAAGDTGSAVQDFTSVIRASIKINAYLKAGKKFNIRLLNGLFGTQGNAQNQGTESDKGQDSHGSDSKGGNDSQKAPSVANPPVNIPGSEGSASGSGSGSDSSHGEDNVSGSVNVDLHL